MKNVTPETVRCPNCKEGVLYDVTSRLAYALNLLHRRCDKCGRLFVVPQPQRPGA